MGFFGTLKKMIDGKPIFEPDENNETEREQQKEQTQVANNGRKTIPFIRVEKVESHNSGNEMTVRAEIRNESSQEIELDKIFLLGTKRELDTRLRPHESREFLVYSGKRPNNRSYGSSEINYKDMLGDYFQARCAVEFRSESDGTFSIHRIKVAGPIKDIE
jgi:hypothetical protein